MVEVHHPRLRYSNIEPYSWVFETRTHFKIRSSSTNIYFIKDPPLTDGFAVFVNSKKVTLVVRLSDGGLIEDRSVPTNIFSINDFTMYRRRIPDKYVVEPLSHLNLPEARRQAESACPVYSV